MEKIAVIGATGMLGISVTVALVKAGFEVTALTRDPDRARRVLPERTNLVQADVFDISSLAREFNGQDAIYLNFSVAPNEKRDDFHAELEGLKNILEAAHSAGIKRIAYLSALIQDSENNDWWVLDVWRNAIELIKSSGIAYTIFYPTNFMETLPHRHIVGGLLTLIGTARYRNFWIAGSDYGAQVARSFELGGTADREYVVQGPEAMTYGEAALRFAANSKKNVRIVTVPLALVQCLGALSQRADFNARMMGTVLRYREEFRAGQTWQELGTPSTTIEEFAQIY